MPGPAIARPGSTAIRGGARPTRADSRSTIARSSAGQPRGRAGLVGGRVRDAHAAAEVDGGQRVGDGVAVLVAHLGEQPDHPAGGELEAVGVEDLRADVAVQPHEVQPRRLQHPAHGLGGVARGQREAELLVLVGGGDELVGVRLDPDRHPHHDVGADVARRGRSRRGGRSRRRSRARSRRPRRPARRSSSWRLLLLPCTVIRSGGKPARSAVRSSPSVQTSSPRPSSATQRAISVVRNALLA